MSSVLSIYFNDDRIYLSIIKHNSSGYNVSYVNSTIGSFDFLNPESVDSASTIVELKNILTDLEVETHDLLIVLSSKHFLTSFIPETEDIHSNDFKELIKLEFLHTLNGYRFEDFIYNVYPIQKPNKSKNIVLLSFLHKEYIEILRNSFVDLNFSCIKFAPIEAIRSFVFNYPEIKLDKVIIFGLNQTFIDIILLDKSKLSFFNQYPYELNKPIDLQCVEFISSIIKDFDYSINHFFFYGNLLTNEILNKLRLSLNNSSSNIKRLNSFRMLHSELTERQKTYCSRVAHIFAPCIGSVLNLDI